MSVVIVGGHDRMVSQYVKICKSFNCKAKVFKQMTRLRQTDRSAGSACTFYKHRFP